MTPTACPLPHALPEDVRARWTLAGRLVLALVAAGLLALAGLLRWWRPEDGELARLVATVAALLVGIPVLAAAARALRSPNLDGTTDLLVALALIAAWVVGDLETAALVPLAMVIGHAIEERSIIGSQAALAALGALTRGRVGRLAPSGQVEEVEAEHLVAGDRIEVRPGARLAVDGRVLVGSSCLDTAPISGESVPREVGPGDEVHAGAINAGGRLEVEVLRTGAATALGRVVALMRDAERAKPAITRTLDRFSGAYLVLVVLAAALLGFASGSMAVLMAVLVAACPCALVVAAPATAVAAVAAAGRGGILITGTAFLERLAACDTLVIDKTGTLTHGTLTALPDADLPAIAARAAAALGRGSDHPVSRACAALDPTAPVAEDLHERPGQGVQGRIDGVTWCLGRPGWLAQTGITVPPPPVHEGPLVGLVGEGAWVAWIRLADTPRPEAAEALADLRSLGFDRQVLCTGDRAAVAQGIAAGLGIDAIDAECLPEQKLIRVRQELDQGRIPLVVGDGINDSLALKAGAVGVAVGGRAAGAAIASADLALVDGDLRRLPTAVRLARRCRSSILLGIALAVAWTLVVVALAAAGLIGPFAAALLHNLGTVLVIINAGRLAAHQP